MLSFVLICIAIFLLLEADKMFIVASSVFGRKWLKYKFGGG